VKPIVRYRIWKFRCRWKTESFGR